jgi:hypothetical protein
MNETIYQFTVYFLLANYLLAYSIDFTATQNKRNEKKALSEKVYIATSR